MNCKLKRCDTDYLAGWESVVQNHYSQLSHQYPNIPYFRVPCIDEHLIIRSRFIEGFLRSPLYCLDCETQKPQLVS